MKYPIGISYVIDTDQLKYSLVPEIAFGERSRLSTGTPPKA
jgi:hypothetical protein